MDTIEDCAWDVDFYQTCLYTVYADKSTGKIDQENEVFEDRDRDRMLAFIRGCSKPCIAFKALAAGRKCRSEEEVRTALEVVYGDIKSSDVVCVGMWQKEKDQVAQNAQWVREILGG